MLREGKATLPLVGHPWLFSGAIGHALAPTHAPPHAAPVAGDLCGLFDCKGHFLGLGYHNPKSQISVRILATTADGVAPKNMPAVATLVRERLTKAAAMRAHVGLPASDTTAWRLCNSEGDDLPGLVIDRMADGAVVLVSTAGARRWVDDVLAMLTKDLDCRWVVVRTAHNSHPSESLDEGVIATSGEVPEQVEVLHHGLRMVAEPKRGQKSGLYTDQFDNHIAVAALAKDRYVIDAYCHGAGFGLHAAHAGARKVVCIDASQHAAELAEENIRRNELEHIEVMQGDAVHLLSDIAEDLTTADDGRPDLVIVDPPKFATRASVTDDALRKHEHLNSVAIGSLSSGGILVSCVCSGRIDSEGFLRMLARSARRAGKDLRLLEMRGAGFDHPSRAAHAEARYLKVAICTVSDRATQPPGSENRAKRKVETWSPIDPST